MKGQKIVFTAPKTAELQEYTLPELRNNEVLVKTEYTVVSGGTERANLLALPNTLQYFPISLGYCGMGNVVQVGGSVQSVQPGDRVLVYHGIHSNYNIRGIDEITKVEDDSVSSQDAAFVIIASMGLGGVRKLALEIGESAMVMGLGLLGMFAVQFCHLNGAFPVIAVDPNPERRALALQLGADYALDPSCPDFKGTVKRITGGRGVNGCVEVTGSAAALHQALDCAAWMGRIALLGCTRVSDSSVDYYSQVHKPGIQLIGAHNFIRPKVESYPHHWTHQDDCRAILQLIGAGRLKVSPVCSRVVDPTECGEIYKQLCEDPLFPIGTVFHWNG